MVARLRKLHTTPERDTKQQNTSIRTASVLSWVLLYFLYSSFLVYIQQSTAVMLCAAAHVHPCREREKGKRVREGGREREWEGGRRENLAFTARPTIHYGRTNHIAPCCFSYKSLHAQTIRAHIAQIQGGMPGLDYHGPGCIGWTEPEGKCMRSVNQSTNRLCLCSLCNGGGLVYPSQTSAISW